MKKAQSLGKTMQKGKSMSSIHQNHQSRVTNKSIDTRKLDSKVSKVSKTNSLIKVHQPLTIQQRQTVKQSRQQSSKPQHQITQGNNSRRKIQSQLESKKSYENSNAISFRPSQQQQYCKTVNIQTSSSHHHHGRQLLITQNNNQLKLKQENDKLLRENRQLKDQVFRLQQASIEDKDKIKTLITRISEIKRDNKLGESSNVTNGVMMSKSKTTASYAQIMKTRGLTERENFQGSSYRNQIEQTPFRILQQPNSQSKYSKTKQCSNPQCEERKRYLQGQLYRQRIKRDQLQQQKRDWQRNKDQLKRQYQDLLVEIHNLRQQQQSVCEQQQ